MDWKTLFPSDHQPTMEEIEDYIGGEAKGIWQSLISYMDQAYKVKPKFSYSICAGKPGWNIKLQKSGQSFGTLYPEENSFSVLIVISYKLDTEMELLIPELSEAMANRYKVAGDYMKVGKWMMFSIEKWEDLEDYKKLINVKMAPKIA